MKAQLKWTTSMKFNVEADGNTTTIDAKSPIGSGSALTPKELVVAGLGGCTAMDVVAYMRKHKQTLTSFEVTVDVTTTQSGQPVMFTHALVTFKATGEVDQHILSEAAHLSQTKYCGVSAMLAKAFPIDYVVILNDQEISRGKAEF